MRGGVEMDCYIGKKQAVRMIGGEQCFPAVSFLLVGSGTSSS